MKSINLIVLLLGLLCTANAVRAQDRVLTIYHDADYSSHAESALSMKMGLETALSEVNNEIQGFRIEVVEKNHRGNTVRSKLHMKQFLKDPDAIFMLGGLHSPPYIKYRKFINEQHLLLLVPWAAGGPITRYSDGENWVFRLSIDDTKAGYRIAQFSVDQMGCKSPHLLLENTPWGKSNFSTMTQALIEKSGKEPAVSWFNWNTKQNKARIILRDIVSQGSDCILFVGNAIEGEQFSKAVISLAIPDRLPIISHWGITGGHFHKAINKEMRAGLELHFIQTCFSFISGEKDKYSLKVFNKIKELYPEKISKPRDIPAPPGFIHSYDLGKLVIAALKKVELTGQMLIDRALLRNALENINTPIKGLVKTYKTPFSTWSVDQDDAHEALGLDDFCMAEYDEHGHVNVNLSRRQDLDKSDK